ncbi:MAG: hypothetical protein GW795_12465 [Cyanobacteria bacterium]|nr:hypothetical protein [Cyanobacteria bacterium CG_2015-16_32_12]NCQ05671.1 hypothetical protein [Cyanobacteria bacterium CG_2015-09_32_10]NCQ42657.1 hypothetical protein [Cyanobacteria bacterium CG_2015-04_32_10]NCS84727.1 hypothetical protein [Cyanobacteria bacterium CG_2015-02_32_10]
MSQKSYLEQYPPITLRNYYREKILQNQAHWFLATETPVTFPPLHQKGWSRYYAIPDFVSSYFRLLAQGSEIVEQILEISQRDYLVSPQDNRPVLLSLMESDIHRVIAPIAITAWLTVDEFRWEKYIPQIPRDLNYGLVTQYPEAICAYGAFMGNFNSPQFLNLLSTTTIEKCGLLARKEANCQIQELKIRRFSGSRKVRSHSAVS